MNNKYSRQYDIIKPEELTTPIRIIGAGGIGSWTTLALAKMGCSKLMVQDFDIVSMENTASQLYGNDDIAFPKVSALMDIISDLTSMPIDVDESKWEPNQEIKEPIVVMALDSIVTRAELWKELKLNTDVRLLIDSRMAGDFLRVFYVPLIGNYGNYEKSLVQPERVDPEPCTGKAVVYNVFMVASIIANLVKKFQKRELQEYKEFAFDFSQLQIL